MPSQMVQAQYDTLDQISKGFDNQHERIRRLASDITCQIDTLRGGKWVGDNADQFYNKLEHELMPGVERLVNALNEASDVTLTLQKILQAGEDEAAAIFNGEGGGASSAPGAGSGDPAEWASNSGKGLDRVDSGGNIQTYRLNLNDPNTSVQDLLKQIPNSDGRPVIFMVHGWNVQDAAARGGFSNTDEWYEAQYGNLPANQRPILVGVDWASTTKPDSGIISNAWNYLDIQERGVATGNRFGETLAAYQRDNPTAQVSIVAHSMGNVVAAHGIQGHDVHVDGYLAVQGVVNSYDVRPGGALQDVVNPNRVGHVIVTSSATDGAMYVRRDNSTNPFNPNLPIGGVGIRPPEGATHIDNVRVGFGGGIGHHSFDPTQSDDVAAQHRRLFDIVSGGAVPTP